MAGQIKTIIDKIIQQRSNGNPALVSTTKTKILLKGIDPQKFSESSDDDPVSLAKIRKIAEELNVTL